MAEFYRMCDFFNWDKDDEEKKEARNLLKDALTQQFNSIYGTEVNSIESWQNLCRVLGITPIPEGLHACREVSNPLKCHPQNHTDGFQFSWVNFEGGARHTCQYR